MSVIISNQNTTTTTTTTTIIAWCTVNNKQKNLKLNNLRKN